MLSQAVAGGSSHDRRSAARDRGGHSRPVCPRCTSMQIAWCKQWWACSVTPSSHGERHHSSGGARCQRSAWAAVRHLRVDVVDRGAGIREADQEALFQAFREIQEPSGKRIGGLGLGFPWPASSSKPTAATSGSRARPAAAPPSRWPSPSNPDGSPSKATAVGRCDDLCGARGRGQGETGKAGGQGGGQGDEDCVSSVALGARTSVHRATEDT